MADWVTKLDDYLELTEREVLRDGGSVSRDAAAQRAHDELDRYTADRAKLPAPVEGHFDQAVRSMETITKRRRNAKRGTR